MFTVVFVKEKIPCLNSCKAYCLRTGIYLVFKNPAMARMSVFSQSGWVETMLISMSHHLPPFKEQQKARPGRKPFGTYTCPYLLDRVCRRRKKNRCFTDSRPAVLYLPMEYVDGRGPRNFCHKRFTGSSYTSWGFPICWTTPAHDNVSSEILMASS